MIGKLVVCAVVITLLNSLVGTLYRQRMLSKQVYRILSVVINALCIYFAQVWMIDTFDSMFSVLLALIGGISLGLQGANVIIRVSKLDT